MYWHGMIEGTFCQEQGRAHFRVRCALPKWRGRSRALPWVADFTQRDEVGEVGCHKWVKSRGGVTPEWIEDDDDFRVVLRRPVAQGDLEIGHNESRDKSRDWEATNIAETVGHGAKIASGDVLKSRDKNRDVSRDRTGGMTTQRTTQQTTQQTTQRMLLKLMPAGNMRNIVSLVMKNPEINIAGMAHVLELSQNGIKYHIKQIRKRIAFKHVGPWNAGHWEIGPKETP